MEYSIHKDKKDEYPIKRYIIYFVLGLLLTIVQSTASDLISIGYAAPDLLLLLLVWICINEGYFIGIIAGFILGIVFDIYTYDIIGTNALAKTIAAPMMAFFHKPAAEKQLTASYRIIPIVFATAVVHNLIYGVFYITLNSVSFLQFFLEYTLASAIYTAAFGIFLYAIGAREPKRTI